MEDERTARKYLAELKSRFATTNDLFHIIMNVMGCAPPIDAAMTDFETVTIFLNDERVQEYMLLKAIVHRLEGDVELKMPIKKKNEVQKQKLLPLPPNLENEAQKQERIKRLTEKYRVLKSA